jgi:hypothetical protein
MIGPDIISFKLIDEMIRIEENYRARASARQAEMSILFRRQGAEKPWRRAGRPGDQRRESSAAAR